MVSWVRGSPLFCSVQYKGVGGVVGLLYYIVLCGDSVAR